MKTQLIKLYNRVENLIISQKINGFDGEKLLDIIDDLYFENQVGTSENKIKNKITRINKKIEFLKADK